MAQSRIQKTLSKVDVIPRRRLSSISNCIKVRIYHFIVDASCDNHFDIYDYFGISIPKKLMKEWEPSEPFPICSKAKCIILSDEHPISLSITSTSQQMESLIKTFGVSSVLNLISRQQFIFTWEKPIEISFHFSELPLNSVLSISFYICFFQQEVYVGTTLLNLFQGEEFQTGIHYVTFEKSEPTKFSQFFRDIEMGKIRPTGFADRRVLSAIESLHPQDVQLFFTQSSSYNCIPKLSDTSKWAKLLIFADKVPEIASENQIGSLMGQPLFSDPCQVIFDKMNLQASTAREFDKIKKLPLLNKPDRNQQEILVNAYQQCLNDDLLLSPLFRSIDWESDAGKHLSELLNERPPVDIEIALEFFTNRFEIPCVRAFAIRCVCASKSDKILRFLPQLIQAVKAPYTENLTKVLIKCASVDVVFCSQLYWLAQIETVTNPDVTATQRIESLFSQLFNRSNLNAEVRSAINKQHKLINGLQKLFDTYHDKSKKPVEIREIIVEALKNQFSYLQDFEEVPFPLDPTKIVCGIDPLDVKVFTSKLRPVVLTFKTPDGGRYRALFKVGDDMRQDQIVIQMYEVMDQIFKSDGLEMHITIYKVLAISDKFGICEFVMNSKAIYDISEESQTILDYLKSDGEPIEPKIDVYVKSLAAFSVMTYILLIGDRHKNNIIVVKDGRLIHIDYGYILGDATKPFSPKLRLSSEMVDFPGENVFQQVCHWAVPAFQILRTNARLILVLLEVMFTAPLACFEHDPHQRLKLVESGFLLQMSENDARLVLQQTFKDSLNSKIQTFYDLVHGAAVKYTGKNADGD